MKKTLLIAGALLALTASMAFAQDGGLRLGWNDCRDAGGLPLRTFACNTNTNNSITNHQLFESCITQPGMNSVGSAFMILDIFLQSSTIDPWWQHGASPACRLTGKIQTNGTNAAGCAVDYWNLAASGVGSASSVYSCPSSGPNHSLLRTLVGISATETSPIPPAQEMFLANITLLNGSTTTCAGCQIPACLSLTSATLSQNPPDQDVVYTGHQAPPGGLNTVTWQADTGCNNDPTPATKSTWGKIKAIYR